MSDEDQRSPSKTLLAVAALCVALSPSVIALLVLQDRSPKWHLFLALNGILSFIGSGLFVTVFTKSILKIVGFGMVLAICVFLCNCFVGVLIGCSKAFAT